MLIEENLIYEFLNYLKFNKSYSDHTLRAYKTDLTSWYVYIKNIQERYNTSFKENEVSKQTYDWIITSAAERKLAKATISRKLSAVKSFLDYLYRSKVVENKISLTIKTPKKEKLLPKFVNFSEIANVLSGRTKGDFLSIRNTLVILLFFTTGMRISELKSVKVSDINFNRNEIRVIGKGNKERIVFFSNFTKDLINEYLHYRASLKPNNDYLFISRLKRRLSENMIRHMISRIWIHSTGKSITPHQLRHSFATFLLNQGVELKYIQEILGHENINTTNVYAKLSERVLKSEYYKSLDKFLK